MLRMLDLQEKKWQHQQANKWILKTNKQFIYSKLEQYNEYNNEKYIFQL